MNVLGLVIQMTCLPLSVESPFHLPEVKFHSPAMFWSFFQSDLTHRFSHPSSYFTNQNIQYNTTNLTAVKTITIIKES